MNKTKKTAIAMTILLLASFLTFGCGKKAEEYVFDDTKEDVDKVASEYGVEETAEAVTNEAEEPSKKPEKTVSEQKEASRTPEKEEPPKDGPVAKELLAQIEKDLNSASCNGFMQCEYSKPSDIFWSEVLYNGCEISTDKLGSKEKELYVAAGGEKEPLGSLFVFKKADVENFVKKMTGEDYAKASHPLPWIYLEQPGLYVTEHGDTNFNPVKCVSGNITNGIYNVTYVKGDSVNGKPAFRTSFKKSRDGYTFISNEWLEDNKKQLVNGLYDEIIQNYAVAVYEQWDQGELQKNGLSYLAGMDYSNDPMNRIGYYLHDIDKDGIDELFIGENFTGDYTPSIYQIFTVKEGTRRLIIEGGERDRFYLGKDDTVYNEGSGSATSYVLFHYKMEGPYMAMYPIDGVLYDGSFPAPGPYFSSERCLWDASKATPVDQSAFDAYVSKAESNYADIRYTPLSTVKILKTDLREPEKKGGYSDEDLCRMALDYYERRSGYRPGISEVDSVNGDLVTIHLYDDMGDHTATSAWYEINRNTGKGSDAVTGDPVDLAS